ncbi:MAG TPA: aminoglycoside phosphotransferase [Nocardioidaceae bacterium]|nr:aminoglycoside phosphotransferase [Nocardioidaceae bacterium]
MTEPMPEHTPHPFAEHLRAYLAHQRWFAGKGRDFEVTGRRVFPWLSGAGVEPAVRIELADIAYDDDAEPETYQVPTAYYTRPQEHLSHALIGTGAEASLGAVFAYDAMHDRDATSHLLRGVLEERTLDGLRFHYAGGIDRDFDAPALLMTGEQSNTSLAYGDVAILKLFRKIAAGRNPDIEVHRALTTAGVEHIAELHGWVEASWETGQAATAHADLAMLQRFLRTATDGWTIALTSVRDLYAEADLHANEVGGDFAGESHRLGAAVADIHRHLGEIFGTRQWVAEDLRAGAARMQQRLDVAVDSVPDLEPYAAGLRRTFDDLAGLTEPVLVQRVHGDLHLGQTLRTVRGWKIIDFEGEPAKPLVEREAFDVPLRDVAGMLRSFDYAAANLLTDHPGNSQIAYRAREWAQRNRKAFTAGYAEAGDVDPAEQAVLMRAYETDKAIYEVLYEARNRPTWLEIPMAAVRRLSGADEQEVET